MFQLQLVLISIFTARVAAFWPSPAFTVSQFAPLTTPVVLSMAESELDGNELIGCRISLTGDVQGGYVRSCIANEAGKFRRLMGTMTPPDDSDSAEIYVEGKRKVVNGFVNWCRKADKKIGLNQVIKVTDVNLDLEPTGQYESFELKTK